MRPSPAWSICAAVLCAVAGISPALASPLQPSAMTWTVPVGTNNGVRDGTQTRPYVDDVLLDTLTFGTTVYGPDDESFAAVARAMVISGRASVNAEYGDLDSGADGNATPFVKAGIIAEGGALPDTTRESVNPNVQDRAIAAAFDSFSLVEGVDGEGPDYTMRLIFQKGIVDNAIGADAMPELVFMERGVNSDFSVRAIIGGTWLAPLYAPTTVTVLRSQLWATPLWIDSIEIPAGQNLGAAGIDLTDFFGAGSEQAIYGFDLSSINGSGADLYGQFMAAEDPSQFRDVIRGLAVPEPGTAALFAGGLLALWLRRRHSKA